jgi:DNA-binding HxlR family transcriptional regulator
MKRIRRSVCPVACTLDIIGDPWTLLVIRDLFCGKRTYGEFAKSPEKIATNILAARLAKLVRAKLVERQATAIPSRSEYVLTERGRSLGPVLNAVAAWGLDHIRGTQMRMLPKSEN